MRAALARFPVRERPTANRLVLWVRPTWDVPAEEWHDLAMSYESLARGAGLEKLVLHVHIPVDGRPGGAMLQDKVVYLEGIGKGLLSIRLGDPGPDPVRPLTAYAQKVLTSERFGVPYPYEIVRMLTTATGETSAFPPGSFTELDLDTDGETLVEVQREPGQNSAHVVVGVITNRTAVVPEGMSRVALLSDPTQGLGNLAEPECRRINAALAYALEHRLPVEWYAVSSGALIALDSGTENMDWIALTLRRLIEFTQAGGEVNIVVTGINVGGQPYWNAEATMLMHTKGHPGHDTGERHGAHRQAGAGLLRCGLGRRQLRDRRIRPHHGRERSGSVLGAQLRRRLRPAAAPLRLHLRRPGGALPAATPHGRPGRPGRPHVPARVGPRLLVRHRR